MSLGQEIWNDWDFLSFSVGKRTAAVCSKCLNIALVSKFGFFRCILKQIYFKCSPACFFFFLQCVSMEWQVVFPEAFLWYGKDIMIWQLEVSAGMKFCLFWGGKLDSIPIHWKIFTMIIFFIVSVVVECSNIDVDAKMSSKESLIMQSYVQL